MNQRTEILKQLKLDIIDKKESIENNPHIDSYGRSYATGRRKNSIARVWVKKGTGNIVVNGKLFSQYFRRKASCMMVQQPFEVTNHVNKHDVYCTVKGGGLSGQAGAIRHAISRALSVFDPSLRHVLKENHFLTRDSRIVERKKYGLAKARCSFQFSKR